MSRTRFQNQVVSIPASYSEFLASSLSLETICVQGFVIFSGPFMVAPWDLFEMYVEIECWAFWTLGCDVSLGEWFLTFQRNIMHLPSESRSPRRTSLNFLIFERESIMFLWNCRIYSASDTVSHPWRHELSVALLWELWTLWYGSCLSSSGFCKFTW